MALPSGGAVEPRPAQGDRPPGEAAAERGEQDPVPLPQPAVGVALVERERDGGGGGVADVGDVAQRPLARQAELVGEMVGDPLVRLVADQVVEVVGAPAARSSAACDDWAICCTARQNTDLPAIAK
ncbi:hypothetical protein LUX33_16440 [Actinomadura madurae]|nr:hypothetical protein [Actinomadura madurae]MCP9949830.1 hypothetical protein [Actinomadura madurae]